MNKEQTDQQVEIIPESYPVQQHVHKDAEYHQWVQNGPYIHCTSCEPNHGAYIGTGHVLIGIEANGHPKLKKVELS